MKKVFFIMAVSAIVMVACNTEKKEDTKTETTSAVSDTESKEEKNKQTAMASVNAMLANNVDEALKDVTADAVEYGDGSMPPLKGKDSIKTMLTSWRNSFSEYKGENLMTVADGDYVVVCGDWSGTFKEDFMGMPTKGKSFKVRDCDIFKYNSDGKITEHKSIQTTAELLNQLGIKPK